MENKAREWANRCTFEHSIGTAGYTGAYDQYGECLAMTSNDKGFTWDRTVQLFYDEKEYFEYGKSEYSNVVTHYTQIVWAASYKVGCAEASCPNSKYKKYYVCQYWPPYVKKKIDDKKPHA